MTEEDELRQTALGKAILAVGALADSTSGIGPAPARRHRRASRAVPLLLLAGTFTLAGGAAAALLSNNEVDQFARDAGIGRQAAREALEQQGLLPLLDHRLRHELPKEYAGLWVARDGVTVTIGMATSRSRHLEAVIGKAKATVGLGTVDPVLQWNLSASAAALDAEQQRTQKRLDAANRGAPDDVEIEPDVRNNRLILHVPAHPTGPQTEVVRAVRAASEVPLASSVGTPRATYLIGTSNADSQPTTRTAPPTTVNLEPGSGR